MGTALRIFFLVLTVGTIAAPAFASATYHENGRLLTATGPWGTGGAQAAGSYVYDALGNVRSWTQGAKTGTVSYGDATNRVTAYMKTGEATRSFAYDTRGNTTDNGDYAFAYDYANQPVAVSGAIPATHEYDGNFKRVKTVENGKTIYQVFSRVTGGLIYRDEVTDGETTDYVSVGGAALRLKKTGATLTPEYVHFDHQGSAVASTDASGAVLWRERYSPWGTRLLKPAGNKGDTGYTGHLMDSATELVYMQSRYYDSQILRFYSTDPVGYQDQLNLYAYVANDPVNKTDPTGEYIESLIDVGFLIADVAAIADSGFTVGNVAAVVGDLAGLALPGATGGGLAARAAVEGAQAAGKAADAAKTVKISASKSPEAAKHIKEAGVEGKKLTVDRAGAAERRTEALKGTETKPGMDRDEVPPAVFKEGGAGSSVRSIPSSDNRSAGAQLGNQLRDVPDGGCVKIEICD